MDFQERCCFLGCLQFRQRLCFRTCLELDSMEPCPWMYCFLVLVCSLSPDFGSS
ncbi:hypothetical protein Golax_009663 [Gossypium laxum]|uniref:Uncharacterized protein n=1 Tax=Gossypium laxum TaxID=34288 RepID=A0A7J8ZFH2_9ROSI|nr:hypothetical protein [Gossypium laxum]